MLNAGTLGNIDNRTPRLALHVGKGREKGTDLNGTYLTLFAFPFFLTSSLAAEPFCISIG